MFSVSVKLSNGRFNEDYFPIRLPDGSFNDRQKYLGTCAEWAYKNVFETHGVALPQAIQGLSDKHEGLWYAANYWLDLLEETCHLALELERASLALELERASPTRIFHMLDVLWTSLKCILHMMKKWKESHATDLMVMKTESEIIRYMGSWAWGHFSNVNDFQVDAATFCKQHLIEGVSDSDDVSECGSVYESDSEESTASPSQIYGENDVMNVEIDMAVLNLNEDSRSEQSTVILDEDGSENYMLMDDMSDIEEMSIDDDEEEFEYSLPNNKTFWNWVIVYVYIKNEAEVEDLLKKMNHELGTTMQTLIDQCLVRSFSTDQD